ncbi:claspin [Ditylenchus destructor]|nr:claspin [Ditylenchus destructor]
MEVECNSPVLDRSDSAAPPVPTPYSGSKKPCSAAHRKLQAILESGQLDANCQPKTFASKNPGTDEISLDDDDEGKSSRKRKAESDPLEEWFARKLSSYKGAKHHEEEVMEARKPKVVKYTEMKKELEQKLSVQRREEFQRRHGFYNADNEIFEDEDEEEEDELTDEEDELEDEEPEEKEDKLEEEKVKLDEEEDELTDEEDELEDEEPEEKEDKLEEEKDKLDEEEDELTDEEDEEEPEAIRKKNKNYDNYTDGDSENSREEEEPELGYENKQHPILPPGESQQLRSITQDFNEALFLCSGSFPDAEVKPRQNATVRDFVEDEASLSGDDAEDKPRRNVAMRDFVEDEASLSGDDAEDKPRQNVALRDFLEDEASLSGDDVGSDIEELGSEFDEYEAEEGDNDELPDEEEIRDNLVKQYMKQTNDEEERHLLKMQEHFLYDADLHGRDMDRSFRFRMRDDLNIDWSKILGNLEDEENAHCSAEGDDDNDAANAALRERKVEYLKWRLEQENKKPKESLDESIGSDVYCSQSSLLSIGQKILSRKKGVPSTAEKPKDQPEGTPSQSSDVVSSPSMLNRDSLLKKASMLGAILKEKPSGSNGHNVQRILFTSIKH